MNFIEYIQHYGDGVKNGTMLKSNGDKYAASSYYNYKNSKYWVSLYQEEVGTIKPEDISPDLLSDFKMFLMNAMLSKNHIKNIIVCVKFVIKKMVKSIGLPIVDLSEIRSEGEKCTAIYNNLDEIELLYNLELTESLARIRDAYIIQCFIGLRFSDMGSFLSNPDRYIRSEKGMNFICIKTQKTGEDVVIPVGRYVDSILKRRPNFGKSWSNTHNNNSLKKIGRKAGLTQIIIKSMMRGGEKTETIMTKFQMMSTHTARRSFATNAYLAGIPSLMIMKITGHVTEQSFMRYIRAGGIENAIALSNHPFFN